MAPAPEQTQIAPSAQGGPMLPEIWRVRSSGKESYDTFTMDFEPADRSRSFAFKPGQFNMVYIFGVGEVPISISGDPARSGVLVHTTRAIGTVTRELRKLKKGEPLGIRGPFGNAWPVEEAVGQDVVIVAGGIGLAPLRPVLYHCLAHREQYGKVVLLYGARTPDDLILKKSLEQWRTHIDLDIHITVDRAVGAWRGNVGVVTTLIPRAAFDPLHTVAMVCGPEIMMRFTVIELAKRGVAWDKMYVSMERNMKCGIGLCGHCQFGPSFICKDGPVYRFDTIRELFSVREI